MQKRAFGDNVMVYILAVVILGAIALVGWKMVFSTTSQLCKTELIDFELNMNKIPLLPTGTVKEFSFDVPCNANKVLVFDSTELPDAGHFSDYPLISDGIIGNIRTNIYVLQNEKIVDSFDVGYLMVGDPYLLCAASQDGKISFQTEAFGLGVSLSLVDTQQSCLSEFVP